MTKYINEVELNEIVESNHRDPHHILGIHEIEGNQYAINVFQPHAKNVNIINTITNEIIPMKEINSEGFFSVVVSEKISYKVQCEGYYNDLWERYDPYSFEPIITDLDRHLFNKGTHYEIYNKLGAHEAEVDGIKGVLFAVWAPNAKRVSVIGDFTSWDGRVFPLRVLENSGIFELFVPGLTVGEKYKFEIKTREGHLLEKSDPYANAAELRPNTSSIVADLTDYEWNDKEWLEDRNTNHYYERPVSIYEVHLGSWKRNDSELGFVSYKELAHELVDYVLEMGYTHIQLMPVSEHPFDGSWGYQVTGYYAATSRFGDPKDFMYFVDHCHKNNIGVLLDWVPGHFPKDAHGLIHFDGTALYEHADPRLGEHPHWGTMIFNYGRNEISNFLISNAFFWIDMFHIDGLRVDAVASMLYLDYGKEEGEWVPNIYGGRENLEVVEFLRHLNSIIHNKYPGILMIAEESTSWPGVSRPADVGGLGFGMKWNMGWMNDFLRYVENEPIHRKYHHNDLTFSMVYAYTENFILVLSHDEVVHGKGSMINKMPGDYWQKFANLRVSYGFMFGHPGKKLLFMGNDIAQFEEWNEGKSLDWHLLEFENHRKIKDYIADLNKLYASEEALYKYDFSNEGFEWINCSDTESSILSFVRKSDNVIDTIVVIANFTPVPRLSHRIGVPYKGAYEEILNSDHMKYGGSGVLNEERLLTINEEWDQREQCVELRIPPLGVTILKYLGE